MRRAWGGVLAPAGLTSLVPPVGLALLAPALALSPGSAADRRQPAGKPVCTRAVQAGSGRRRADGSAQEASHRSKHDPCLLTIRTCRSALQHATTKRHP